MNLRIGQKLWYVPLRYHGRGSPKEVTVTKIGRKWATLDNDDRVHMDSMDVDGGEMSSPAKCYLSRDLYEREMERESAWQSLRKAVDEAYLMPPTLGLDEIIQFRNRVRPPKP